MCLILYLDSSIDHNYFFVRYSAKYILNIKHSVWCWHMRNGRGESGGCFTSWSAGTSSMYSCPSDCLSLDPRVFPPTGTEICTFGSHSNRNKPFYCFFGYWSLPQRSTSLSPVYYLLNYWLFFGSPVLQSSSNSSALNEVSKMIDNASVIISACSLRTFRWDYLSLLICEHLVCHHHFLCSFSTAQTTVSLIVFSLSHQLNQKVRLQMQSNKFCTCRYLAYEVSVRSVTSARYKSEHMLALEKCVLVCFNLFLLVNMFGSQIGFDSCAFIWRASLGAKLLYQKTDFTLWWG